MKKFICLFLLVLIVCSCATPVSAVDSVLGKGALDSFAENEPHVLQYSTFHSWNANMLNYNCYAFVLGLTNGKPYPGQYAGLLVYDGDIDIDEMADDVKNDLLSDQFSYECVRVQSTMPSVIDSEETVIAVRKEKERTSYLYECDFHFSILTDEGWLHKPDDTAVLKFNNPPSNNVDWNNECVKNGNQTEAPNIVYDSDIMYIVFKYDHGGFSIREWTENHYHDPYALKHYFEFSCVCSDCGRTYLDWAVYPCTGPQCELPWSFTPEHEVE